MTTGVLRREGAEGGAGKGVVNQDIMRSTMVMMVDGECGTGKSMDAGAMHGERQVDEDGAFYCPTYPCSAVSGIGMAYS